MYRYYCWLLSICGALFLTQPALGQPVGPADRKGDTETFPKGWAALSFTGDGEKLVSLGEHICIWQVSTGRLLHRFEYQRPPVKALGDQILPLAVSLSGDGKLLTIQGTLWDLATGKQVDVRWPRQDESVLRRIALSANGKSMALLGDAIYLREVGTGKTIHTLPAKDDGRSHAAIVFSKDGKSLAGVAVDGSDTCVVRFWDVAGGKQFQEIAVKDKIVSLAISPDGKMVATVGFLVRLWEVATGKQIRTVGKKIEPGEGGPQNIAFAPDGNTLASWGLWGKGTVDLYEVTTGKLRTQLKDPKGYALSFAYAPDGRTAAISSQDGTIRIVNPTTGEEIQRLRVRRTKGDD